ncbi:MAG TPA: glycosyltransferase, partial [Solirubrobacteraceae bacterium]|nr:glycosyltransferase [Solirubrobacteraceae bacterium]
VGVAGALLGRALGLPLIGSYHTELSAYTRVRSGDERLAGAMEATVGMFYGACDVVLSPGPASDEALRELGVAGERIMRWDRGVDGERFGPPAAASGGARLAPCGEAPGGSVELGEKAIVVLYAGRITREKGADLLAEAFLAAHEREPRLHLVLAGGGPEREGLAERLGERATFLGWLSGAELPRAYAAADMFLFPSETDTFGQVILEAQASGLPVIAVAKGGPVSLIEDRVSGLLCEAQPQALADAVLELASSPLLCERLASAGLAATAGRTWEAALARLAEGYSRALTGAGTQAERETRAA